MIMYYIRKYSNRWAIFNDDTDRSRLLIPHEIRAVAKEFPQLSDEKVLTFFADRITSIQNKP